MNSDNSKERIKWIDFLKGIACMIVIIGHTHSAYNDNLTQPFETFLTTVCSPFLNGSLMVCLFSVLSGYVSFKDNQKVNLIKAMIKRYLQLMIPILFTGIIVAVIQRTIGFAKPIVRAELGITSSTYLETIPLKEVLYEGLIGVLFRGQCTINPAFWMMRSLFFGTIICRINNFLIGLTKSRLRGGIIVLGIMLSIIIKDHIILSVLLGYLVKFLRENYYSFLTDRLAIVIIVITSFMAGWGHHLLYIIISQYITEIPKSFDAVGKWSAIWMFFLVWAIDNYSKSNSFTYSKGLIRVGKVCMGMFCFHNILICGVGIDMFSNCGRIFGYDLSFIIVCVLIVLLTIALSCLYEMTVGEFANKLIRKIRT